MENNIFLQKPKKLDLEAYMGFDAGGRQNLGDMIPVNVYRLMEYSMRQVLSEEFGSAEQIRLFRKAGFRAGEFFAKKMLDLELPFNEFVSKLQDKIQELKIGVLRIESVDESTGKIVLTVAEDADCSGLPSLGEVVCNYDEGFLSGVLTAYTGVVHEATEISCWATGDRVCRFSIVRQQETK